MAGGESNKPRPVVTPLLETRQPNVYLAGDVLSPAYFQTADFTIDSSQFAEIKRRGNIKSAMRDGVLVAEVIAQKLAGKQQIDVKLVFAERPPDAAQNQPEKRPTGSLVTILPSGVEAQEYSLKPDGPTTIGRTGCRHQLPGRWIAGGCAVEDRRRQRPLCGARSGDARQRAGAA